MLTEPHTDTSPVKIGINILETLTTGMYRNPLVMYREYIQNSCDAIDEAYAAGLLKPEEEEIEIWIEPDKVVITDNGTGIPASDFRAILYSIGESRKDINTNRGFRGIGHWCGFANCSTLTFISKAAGENVRSVMKCNAETMRRMMLEHRTRKKSYSIDDVLSETITFSPESDGNTAAHYFRVVMDGINVTDELCNPQTVRDYLSFTLPVGYAPQFPFREKILAFARSIGQEILQYNISINGEKLLKQYQRSFDTSQGDDKISDVKFKEIRDDHNNLIAWLWYGCSAFKAQIASSCKMRGLRLRCKNIQLGEAGALRHLFSESSGRGIFYYVGEVFAVEKELIPDSQRDYFEPNEARRIFEQLLANYFHNGLTKLYQFGSKLNVASKNLVRSQNDLKIAQDELENINSQKTEYQQQEEKIKKLQETCNKMQDEVNILLTKSSKSDTVNEVKNEVYENIVKNISEKPSSSSTKDRSQKKETKKSDTSNSKSDTGKPDNKFNEGSNNPDKENKIIQHPNETVTDKRDFLNKIFDIIQRELGPEISAKVINKIKEELN